MYEAKSRQPWRPDTLLGTLFHRWSAAANAARVFGAKGRRLLLLLLLLSPNVGP